MSIVFFQSLDDDAGDEVHVVADAIDDVSVTDGPCSIHLNDKSSMFGDTLEVESRVYAGLFDLMTDKGAVARIAIDEQVTLGIKLGDHRHRNDVSLLLGSTLIVNWIA